MPAPRRECRVPTPVPGFRTAEAWWPDSGTRATWTLAARALGRGPHDHGRASAPPDLLRRGQPRAVRESLDARGRADLRVDLEGVADGFEPGPRRAVVQARFELGLGGVALAGARRGDRVDQRESAVDELGQGLE